MTTQPDHHRNLSVLSDDELLELARGGDVDAFAEILARHAPWLAARARDLWRVRGGTRSACDWVQTVHRRAMADFHQQPPQLRSLRGWLLTILRHAVVDAVRKRAAQPDEVEWTESLFAADTPAADPAEQAEELQMARRAISRLSPQDQTILEWCFRDSLTDGEIAVRLGMEVEAVKKRRQRALHQVRRSVAPARGFEETGT